MELSVNKSSYVGKTLKILLVEDDPIIQKVHRAMLHSFGCQVVLAKNGNEALQQANDNFDLILIGYRLARH